MEFFLNDYTTGETLGKSEFPGLLATQIEDLAKENPGHVFGISNAEQTPDFVSGVVPEDFPHLHAFRKASFLWNEVILPYLQHPKSVAGLSEQQLKEVYFEMVGISLPEVGVDSVRHAQSLREEFRTPSIVKGTPEELMNDKQLGAYQTDTAHLGNADVAVADVVAAADEAPHAPITPADKGE